MARNHIHLAVDTPGSGRVISGARATSTVFIYLEQGYPKTKCF